MDSPTIPQPEDSLSKRIAELNTKAYYLLVALSFLYAKGTVTTSLKVALTLTAAVAVLPIQDYVPRQALVCVRFVKIIFLAAALFFTLYWLWTAKISS